MSAHLGELVILASIAALFAVAVTVEDGKRVAYTIGCPDPFPLDGSEPNIEIVEDSGMFGNQGWKQWPLKLEPPEKARAADHVKRRLAAEDRLRRDEKRGIVHGYRGFGR